MAFEAAPPAAYRPSSGVAESMPFRAPPAPPLNVDALAEQVMNKINRRMTAWRERTGRV
jgi:hypothetical protein